MPMRFERVTVSRARRGALFGLACGASFALWTTFLMLMHGSVWIPRRAGGATHGGVAVALYLTLMPVVGAVVVAFPGLFANPLRAYVTGVVLGLASGTVIGAVNMDMPVQSWDGAISVVFFALTVGGYGGIVAHRSLRV